MEGSQNEGSNLWMVEIDRQMIWQCLAVQIFVQISNNHRKLKDFEIKMFPFLTLLDE